ncbi:WYL domain-containing protein [Streptomyces sp. NPDC047097]|uniref:helix-turn-helix transcriptional regulator n=1 Tax=Streptomyces sp. NPDC047097 TaxID=3155260 RepID=UPI0033E76516
MRADRLLSLLLLLQNRGRMTAPELAERLEVSVRTVYRDVEALAAAGVPVLADRGPEGGYRLVEGYRTRLTGLTAAEADALFLVGAPGPARDLGLGGVLATARLKVQAALPAELAERARLMGERFHLDAPGWLQGADPVPQLAAVTRAVWEQRLLRGTYRGPRGEVRRELRPLGVVLKSGTWYLVATTGDPATAPVRTYRVSRFTAAEVAEEGFERPAGFALAAYWEESSLALESRIGRVTARLRLSPRACRLLPMMYGAAGGRALAQAREPGPDGWVETELAVEASTVAVGDLLRLGPDAEVLGPPELRRAVAEAVTALAARYPADAGPLVD